MSQYTVDEEWIRNNDGLIWHVVNRYSNQNEDLYQVAVMAAIASAPKYDPNSKASFSAYIYKGMRYAVYNELRKDKADKRNGGFVRCGLEEYMDVIHYDCEMERNLESELFVKRVLSVSNLTSNEEQAFNYNALEGIPCRDVAKLMNISSSRVSQLCTSAKRKVRVAYDREILQKQLC